MSTTAEYQIEPVTRDSVIHKCAEAICRFIEVRGLQPEDRLPSETALSVMLRVSRNSVRESMRMLHALGFVDKSPGRGIVVKAALGQNQPQSISDSEVLIALATAVEVRQIIETKCMVLAIQIATDADLERMRESLLAFEGAQKSGDVFSVVHAHLAFHDAVVMSARNKFLNAMYQQVRFMIADIGAIGAKDLLLDKEHFAAHWQIYTAIKERNVKAVRPAIKKHNQIAGPLRQLIIKHTIEQKQSGEPKPISDTPTSK